MTTYINANLSVREAGPTATAIVMALFLSRQGISNKGICREVGKSGKTVATALDLLAERQVAVKTTGGWVLSTVARQMMLAESGLAVEGGQDFLMRRISVPDNSSQIEKAPDPGTTEAENLHQDGNSPPRSPRGGGYKDKDSNTGEVAAERSRPVTAVEADLNKLLRAAGVFWQLIPQAAADLADEEAWVRWLAGHIRAHQLGEYGQSKRGAAIWPMVQARMRPPEEAMPPEGMADADSLLAWLKDNDPEEVAKRQRAEYADLAASRLEADSAADYSRDDDPPPTELERRWFAVLTSVKMELPKATYDTWLRDTRLAGVDGDLYSVEVPNAYAKDWLQNRMAKSLARTIETVERCPAARLAFVVRGFHGGTHPAE